jgi:hypothetical protein
MTTMTKPNPGYRPLPIIHIGLPKTATKTLQWRLFALHSEVFYLGRFDGGPFRQTHRAFQACRDQRTLRIMDQIAYRNIHDCDLDACRAQLHSYLDQEAGPGQHPVWSWESYCTDSLRNRQRRAENLKAVLGEAKILATIRHPVRLLESAYLQQLKRDNIGARARRGKPAFYRPIDDWVMRDDQGEVSNLLDYPRTIGFYAEAFGSDNVCVATFEDLLADAPAFWTRLCAFMEIDAAEAIQLIERNDDNTRWTSIQLQRLQAIRRSPLRAIRFRFADRRGRRRMLDLARDGAPVTVAERAKPTISAEVRTHVLRRTLEGNRWLDERFLLGLEHKGYFT